MSDDGRRISSICPSGGEIFDIGRSQRIRGFYRSQSRFRRCHSGHWRPVQGPSGNRQARWCSGHLVLARRLGAAVFAADLRENRTGKLDRDENRHAKALTDSIRQPTESTRKMTKFGGAPIESLDDALAHARGETFGVRVYAVALPDVRAIRRNLHMSQQVFAKTYRIPLPTLKNWEQGRRHPDAPAAAYLLAISRLPSEVSAALAQDT